MPIGVSITFAFAFSGLDCPAVVPVPGEIEGHDQHAPEIIAGDRERRFPFLCPEAAQPFVDCVDVISATGLPSKISEN